MSNQTAENGMTLTKIISQAIQIPGVKVDRDSFLHETFKSKSVSIRNQIIEVGPIDAGCTENELRRLAEMIVIKRTVLSAGASFMAGLPGGSAMAATIPADILQFYGVALRLAQELSYLYGAENLWVNKNIDMEKITNQLILYCGVMFGASGAAQTVRILSSSLAKQALKKLPQQALTKTFYYPIIKSIAKAVGIKMTKEIFAKGTAKIIPLLGGIVSGGITLFTLRPMSMRLVNALDEANFSYSREEFEADWRDVMEECETDNSAQYVLKEDDEHSQSSSTILNSMKEAKSLLDEGLITEEEYEEIKAKLIAKF